MNPHVYITRRIMPEAMEIVGTACRWELNESDTLLSAAQLAAGLRGKAGVICMISDKFTAAVMEALPDLRCISTIIETCSPRRLRFQFLIHGMRAVSNPFDPLTVIE